jgi:hypothetical protein
LFACFVGVLVTWMSFASDARELRRDTLSMIKTHIVMSSLIFRLLLTLVLCLASLMDLTIAHIILVHERTTLSLDALVMLCPHRDDHTPCRHGFHAGGSYTRFEPRHLDDPRFPRRGSRPTGSKGEVQKTVKTSSCHMVKCWIPKIYLTNPSTEPSTSSHLM